MKALIISSIFLMLGCAQLRAEDCSEKFRVGEFGVPQSDSIVASGKLYGPEFVAVYMEKQRVEDAPEVCRYVYAFDVFRLTLDRREDFFYAGCYGDINGDGARDYVLLLTSAGDERRTQLKAFIHTGDGYRVVSLGQGGVIDSGYIPRCIRRPPDGIFHFLEDGEVKVVGDLITYGWYTYFWENDDLREILTSD